MSQFPAIKPASRSFTPGILPVKTFASMSGKETRVILGNKRHSHEVTLSFAHINQTKVRWITNHWYNRQGTALDFTLPADVWAGWDTYTSAVPSNQKWRYEEPPDIKAVAASIMNVSIKLVSLA